MKLFVKVIILLALTAPLFAAEKPADGFDNLDGAVVKTYKNLGKDGELKVYIFNPEDHKASDESPAIVFFFGGGWVGGTPTQFAGQSKYLASRGMVAICAEYRTTKKYKTTPLECVKDAKSAVRWVRKNAKDLGIDSERIAAGGGSAGGHLAAAAATLADFDEDKDKSISCVPNALVLFNPVFDNGPNGYVYDRLKEEYKKFSPIDNIKKGLPPTLVMLGTNDNLIPVETAEKFKALAEKVGARCDLKLYEGQKHGFFNRRRNSEMYSKTVTDMDVFLTSIGYLKEQPTEYYVYYVSPAGDDGNNGSGSKPFKTISAAAAIAQPGDVVTVHEGVYRERINPPRGGTGDDKRIVYQAAPGEEVVIKGSEIVKGWKKEKNDTWKVTLPNGFFGDFNPYNDLISGDWFRNIKDAKNHTGAVYLNGNWLAETFTLADVTKPVGETPVWFAQVDDKNTTIWAQLKGVDPNRENVEINVRQSVFYPEKPGINYITVRGFTMEQAATPWAPPTAEQIGLIGTHWSKGWVIENNRIRHSACSGIALGKHGDEFDNTSQNSAEGYVETINRALKRGWSKENIGHHIVRNNHISHCGQAGVVGSMGAVFSEVTGNVIHDIHLDRTFGGAEMAGIKFHGAIDTVISNNHIYRCGGHGGIWLDWMNQGTRVTGNLLHDNVRDLFVEVNHGPFVVDNNIMLSPFSILVNSQGCAYVHNLITGRVEVVTGEGRKTPYLKEHSTEVAGLADNPGGDERYYNNLIVNEGLSEYDPVKLEMFMGGNVYLNGAKPSKHESDPLNQPNVDPGIKLVEKSDGVYFHINCDETWLLHKRRLVTGELLGKAKAPNLPYMDYDGSTLKIDTDYFGNKRNTDNPSPGPFELAGKQVIRLKVWPKK